MVYRMDGSTYTRVELIKVRDGLLNVASMDGLLDLLTSFDGRVFLFGLQVCLFLELLGGLGISLHHQVVEDQSIDITVMLLAVVQYQTTCDWWFGSKDKKGTAKFRVFEIRCRVSPHGYQRDSH